MKHFKLLTALFLILSLAVSAQDKTKPEKPFAVYDRSSKVSRVDIRKDNKGETNVIQIDAGNASGGTNMINKNAPLPPAEITNINIIAGNYNQTRQVAKNSRGVSLQLLDVVFPCRVRATMGDQFVDFEIKEAGFWKVAVALTN